MLQFSLGTQLESKNSLYYILYKHKDAISVPKHRQKKYYHYSCAICEDLRYRADKWLAQGQTERARNWIQISWVTAWCLNHQSMLLSLESVSLYKIHWPDLLAKSCKMILPSIENWCLTNREQQASVRLNASPT